MAATSALELDEATVIMSQQAMSQFCTAYYRLLLEANRGGERELTGPAEAATSTLHPLVHPPVHPPVHPQFTLCVLSNLNLPLRIGPLPWSLPRVTDRDD